MNASSSSDETSVFELKGSVLTVMVLHVKVADPEKLYPLLKSKIESGRSFFKNAPLLIDLKALAEEEQSSLDFLVFSTFLRGLGLVPVAVRSCTDSVIEQVLAAGLGILPAATTEKKVPVPEENRPREETEPSPPEEVRDLTSEPRKPDKTATMVVTQPVRSGQQIVAPDGDLIVLSSVNAGAEVIAAGNIHIYGPLRGRAVAGIQGNSGARIFSLQCDPELIAVGDAYVVNDLLDPTLRKQSVIISNKDGKLRFERIGTFDPYHG